MDISLLAVRDINHIYIVVDGKKYFFDQTTGAMSTGIHTVNGESFYFSPEYGYSVYGFYEIEGDFYLLDETTDVMLKGYCK